MSEKQPFTKKLLRQILRVSESTLNRYLKKIYPKLILQFPNFDITARIIPDHIFFWLLKKLEVDNEIACRMIIEIYHPKEQNNYESLKNSYGLNQQNIIYSNDKQPK